MAKQQPTRIDLYQQVTDRMVEALEKGTAPWVRPWASSPGSTWRSRTLPYNGCSGHQYRGVNVMILWSEMLSRGIDDPRFYSYRQAEMRGGQVRKGEKGCHIVFYKPMIGTKTDAVTGDIETVRFPLLRSSVVFSRSQIEWKGEVIPQPIAEPTLPTYTEAARILRDSGAIVGHGGDQACYSPHTDRIMMPVASTFTDEGAYWSTALHELTHWTGHKSRMDRTFGKRFGDDAYAVEELVAELGSAFLCAQAGVGGTLQHPEYLAQWLKVLKADKRAIFTASSAAQKAADFLAPSVTEGETEEESEEQVAA